LVIFQEYTMREAPILPPARAAVLRFLEARSNRLKRYGVGSVALIPALHDGEMGFYSSNTFRCMKAGLEARVNKELNGRQISFTLKTFRDTYCQMNIDMRPENLSAISQTMGHSTTKTTEEHYGRIRNDRALDDIEKAWESRSTPPKDPKGPMTGYA
jgi:integrase